MPQTAAQRNRTYRARLAQKGATTPTVAVDRTTAQRLRAMAREHQQSMGSALQLASLLAQRALAEPTTGAAE